MENTENQAIQVESAENLQQKDHISEQSPEQTERKTFS